MCFSAEVDLVVGSAVTLVGVDAVRHVGPRRDLPLAILPVVLGVHLIIEAAVWHGLEGRDSFLDLTSATVAYLAIAFVVVPILAPLALVIREPRERALQLLPFLGLGALAAAVLGNAMWDGPIVARVEGHHVAYHVPLTSGGLMVAAYVAAACGPALLSANRRIRWFGLANLAAVGILVMFEKAALISIWCAWAAVTSAAIALHLRKLARTGRIEPEAGGRTDPTPDPPEPAARYRTVAVDPDRGRTTDDPARDQ